MENPKGRTPSEDAHGNQLIKDVELLKQELLEGVRRLTRLHIKTKDPELMALLGMQAAIGDLKKEAAAQAVWTAAQWASKRASRCSQP